MIPGVAAMPPLRLVVVDDNPVVRAGLQVLLSGRHDIQVVAEAADGAQALAVVQEHRPDAVLLDVRMPGVDGISALPYLVQFAPVMMLTYSGEPEIIHEAIRLGAVGYLVHGEFSADQLVAAVQDMRTGRAHLTSTPATALLSQIRRTSGTATPGGLGNLPQQTVNSQMQSPVSASESVTAGLNHRVRFGLSQREEEVMELIADGMNNQQIAATCFISEKTVKNHINRIFAKLHAGSRSEAIAVWLGRARRGR